MAHIDPRRRVVYEQLSSIISIVLKVTGYSLLMNYS
jgi:hypothetical protein